MSYDRAAASRILAGLAGPALFASPPASAGEPRRIRYRPYRTTPEAGSRLTFSQRQYLERFMRPCRDDQVTTATHRMTWTGSDGVPATGHFMAGGLGPIVPIAVRETTLALWGALAADRGLAERIDGLGAGDRAVLDQTTTDRDPLEIFRIGVEATGRALGQHALLAAGTPYTKAVDFARAMARSGLFSAVAGQWHWELQAATNRRGMVPVRLVEAPGGLIRYTSDSVDVLRRMKDTSMADARAVMARATGPEGLTTEQAVHRYHDELDLISRQYALLAPGSRPRCLAQPNVLPAVAAVYVETFAAVVEALEIEAADQTAEPAGEDWLFHVPDMSCRHCQVTIRTVLESMDIAVREVDLGTKRVVAEFRSARNRERAFDAIRDSGYTPLGSEWVG